MPITKCKFQSGYTIVQGSDSRIIVLVMWKVNHPQSAPKSALRRYGAL